MQHADEDADGRIEYKEFIPLGVEMMQVRRRVNRLFRGVNRLFGEEAAQVRRREEEGGGIS